MTTTAQAWTEEMVELAGTSVQLVKGGTGEPLLILHDELGHPGWLRFHQGLSRDYTLHIPSHPGFGATPYLDWIMNMRDMAGWYLEALDDLDLGPVNMMGFSLGGWLAAEMATMDPGLFKKLVLVGAAGVKPPVGEIHDIFLVVAKELLTTSFLDPDSVEEFQTVCPEEPTPEQAEAWEVAREQACRQSWKPYMHYPALPRLLTRVGKVPTLLVWGREDTVVPLSAGQLYNDSIPGSRLEVIDRCGHRPEVEKTDQFLGVVRQFLAS